MVVEEKKAVRTIPEGYTAVTPWIISPDSNRVITFLKRAFNAEEIPGSLMANETGGIAHVEVKVEDAIIMLFDAGKNWPPTPAFLRLFVRDCDKSFQKAVKAGARQVTKPTMLSFGAKVSRIADPFGNIWWLQEQIEDEHQLHPDDEIIQSDESPLEKGMKYVQDSLHTEMSKRALPVTL